VVLAGLAANILFGLWWLEPVIALLISATSSLDAAVLDARAAANLFGELPRPFEPIEHDLGSAAAAVRALYESTFRDACVIDWMLDETTMELTARLQVIGLSHKNRERVLMI